MDDRDVRQRLSRLDGLLEQLEQAPGPTAALALEAVEALAEVYGEALRRLMECAAAAPEVADAVAGDELVGHLLGLHGIHPAPAEERVRGALDQLRPYVHSHGGEIELTGIEGGVARVRLSGTCQSCSSSSATLEVAVKEAVLAAAPELAGVEAVAPATLSSPLIPAESLLRRPASAGGTA
jgi:Fe-S cluster biogenesis protein NfuA